MNKKLLIGILGGIIGFIVGIIGGGYLGLILGGTFLGSFDIYQLTGLEGYELTSYMGAIIGAIIAMFLGVRFSIKIFNDNNKE